LVIEITAPSTVGRRVRRVARRARCAEDRDLLQANEYGLKG